MERQAVVQEVAEAATCAYRQVCVDFQRAELPQFIHFNSKHLPSALDPVALSMHAALNITCGDAPMVPDYIDISGLRSDSRNPNVDNNDADYAFRTTHHADGCMDRVETGASHQINENVGARNTTQYFTRLRQTLSMFGKTSHDLSPSRDWILRRLEMQKCVGQGKPIRYVEQEGTGSNRLVDENKNLLMENNPLLPEHECPSMTTSAVQTGVLGSDRTVEESARRRRGANSVKDRRINAAQIGRSGNANVCRAFVACGQCVTRSCTKEHALSLTTAFDDQQMTKLCVNFERRGFCPFGVYCCFGKRHTDARGMNLRRDGTVATVADLGEFDEQRKSEELNVISDEKKAAIILKNKHSRMFHKEGTCMITHPGVVPSVSFNERICENQNTRETSSGVSPMESDATNVVGANGGNSFRVGTTSIDVSNHKQSFGEKIKGKLFLAPLTTVGNLPFRRLCCKLGADVTVSEMAVAKSLIEGKTSELSLLKRHKSETIFGVQVAGGNPAVMSMCADMLRTCDISCDFIDINAACPLEQLHKRFRAGACMLDRPRVIETVVESMVAAYPTMPITIKLRTANHGKKHRLHSFIHRIASSGVSAIFLHGRTALQRYTKAADWDYVLQCKSLVASGVPLIGCGDIMSYDEYDFRLSTSKVDNIMIGRGALIKPWIFTEIKENRVWDISASERLELVEEFVRNGLEHWGSDSRGVATTRRFLLELLSFQHRYVPPPFLEFGPQLIQWRPCKFVGRSDLETKLASPNAKDWIELSSMFLGQPPKDFVFIPKHISSSYVSG